MMFAVFLATPTNLGWRPIAFIEAPAAKDALQIAKRAGYYAPVVAPFKTEEEEL